MRREYSFFIEEKITPSLNTFMREHWRKQRAATKEWADYLLVFTQNWDRKGGFTHMKITRRSTSVLDVDNLAGGCKGLIDAIRRWGFIADDDPASIEITFAQEKVSRDDKGMFIELSKEP